MKIGFKRLETDSSVYYLSDSGDRFVNLTSHVDDLLMFSPSIKHIQYVH